MINIYENASNYIRSLTGETEHGLKMDEQDAGSILLGMSKALSMESAELAAKLSVYLLKHEEEIIDEEMKAMCHM